MLNNFRYGYNNLCLSYRSVWYVKSPSKRTILDFKPIELTHRIEKSDSVFILLLLFRFTTLSSFRRGKFHFGWKKWKQKVPLKLEVFVAPKMVFQFIIKLGNCKSARCDYVTLMYIMGEKMIIANDWMDLIKWEFMWVFFLCIFL